MKTENAVAVAEPKAITGNSPADMIRMAVNGNANLEQLEKLLTLQMRYEENEARKAYHEAMSEFKKNPPSIDKDKHVSYGNTKYSHASLYNVVEKISAELSKCGLSASWTTHQNGSVTVTCKITHVQGHSEETSISAPNDKSGSKNDIQAIGSTITYLQRYTLLALTGLATHDQDNDGGEPSKLITDAQVKELTDRVNAKNIDNDKFLSFMGVKDFSEIKMSDYGKADAAIKASKGGAK